jgi:uncharacterized coiled-coil protein SlyX
VDLDAKFLEERLRFLEKKAERTSSIIESQKEFMEKEYRSLNALIQKIEEFQSKLVWCIIGLFGSSTLTLLMSFIKR